MSDQKTAFGIRFLPTMTIIPLSISSLFIGHYHAAFTAYGDLRSVETEARKSRKSRFCAFEFGAHRWSRVFDNFKAMPSPILIISSILRGVAKHMDEQLLPCLFSNSFLYREGKYNHVSGSNIHENGFGAGVADSVGRGDPAEISANNLITFCNPSAGAGQMNAQGAAMRRQPRTSYPDSRYCFFEPLDMACQSFIPAVFLNGVCYVVDLFWDIHGPANLFLVHLTPPCSVSSGPCRPAESSFVAFREADTQ